MASFYEALTSGEKEILQPLIDHIIKLEPHLEVTEGRYMKIESALLFEEEGFSKYALTKNKNDFSIHNMVMYGFPEVAEFIKTNGRGLKIQKNVYEWNKDTISMSMYCIYYVQYRI